MADRGNGSGRRRITVDGNEAAASVAYRASEAIAIYPITPSSPMAEVCDEWASRGKQNLWGAIPEMSERQSEARSEARRVGKGSGGRRVLVRSWLTGETGQAGGGSR